ncbi:MAG: hypothetical protein ACRDFB_02130, partial [Rhabdochlamydiaceae bacterium]
AYPEFTTRSVLDGALFIEKKNLFSILTRVTKKAKIKLKNKHKLLKVSFKRIELAEKSLRKNSSTTPWKN